MQGHVLQTPDNPTTIQTSGQPHSPSPSKKGGRPAKRSDSRAGDLRLNTTQSLAQKIASRTEFLPASERVLLEQVFIQGAPITRIAALAGADARSIRRRAKRLAARALSAAFYEVAMHSAGWTDEMKAVGEAVFIRGMSARAASRALGLPYRVAAFHAATIRTLAKSRKPSAAKKRGAA
jgi:hypothetical protein